MGISSPSQRPDSNENDEIICSYHCPIGIEYIDDHRESSVRMAIEWKYIFNFVLFEGISIIKQRVVPQVGFEPTRPKAEDFESTKSTSSITAA